VRKVRDKGLEAILARAEDVALQGLNADIFVSFEMLEHLPNPIQFLKALSEKTTCKAFVVTVPYVAQSRVGLHHIRQGRSDQCTPENTHIFELCPADWRLLFSHAGWSVKKEMRYLQYPRFHALRVTKTLWERLDFEGFWGAILQRDHAWNERYVGSE
jgi:2-polyprenyl-3-methyl-5-hydroxy-6-metoxy-1,4-benzoquinol methylase